MPISREAEELALEVMPKRGDSGSQTATVILLAEIAVRLARIEQLLAGTGTHVDPEDELGLPI